MLVREAKWFARQIADQGGSLFPMVNVGSHTEQFRAREQPWIDRYLFAPARAAGRKVVHLDIQAAEGVDLVGDLTEPKFLAEVAALRFRSAFCANLLEHVPNPAEVARAVAAAVEPGGYLLVSCPNLFPYHPDPLDTMFRPSVEELAALFPGTTLVRGERLAGGNLTTYMFARFAGDPFALVRNFIRRRHQAVRKTAQGLSARQWIPWLWRTFYQTCLVLRKSH